MRLIYLAPVCLITWGLILIPTLLLGVYIAPFDAGVIISLPLGVVLGVGLEKIKWGQ